MSGLQLSPGERAEIVVELTPGEDTVLRSYEPALGTNPFEGRFAGADDEFDLLEIRAAGKLEDRAELPATLVEPEWPDPPAATGVRRFELRGTSINGLDMNMGRIDQVVERGTTEVWEVENTSGTPHNFHVHDVRFRVLDLDAEPPPAGLSGLKDRLRAAGRVGAAADRIRGLRRSEAPYMFHCQILQHEDRGMMGQFVVVEPGQAPGAGVEHDH